MNIRHIYLRDRGVVRFLWKRYLLLATLVNGDL